MRPPDELAARLEEIAPRSPPDRPPINGNGAESPEPHPARVPPDGHPGGDVLELGLQATLYRGEALELLRRLPSASADAAITDPPYSSGGFTRGDRMQDPNEKYVQTGTELIRSSFTGDNRDARSWCYWSALWLSELARVLRPGAYVFTFCDWRQLPLAADALQAGGFVWRGIAAWDKGLGARAPHTGYLRHQCEFLAWGSNGPLPQAVHGGPWPGCFQVPVLQSDKHHMTGKPSALMRELVKIVRPGGVIVDPFMGSGTTGVACAQTARRFVGIELDPHYFDVASRRVRDAIEGGAQRGLFDDERAWT